MKHSTWGSVPLCMDPTGMWAGDMCRGLQRFARPHTPFVLCTDSLWWFCASESKPDPYLKIHSVRWTTYHQHLSYTCTGQLPCVSFKLSILSLFFPPFHHLSARPLLFIPLCFYSTFRNWTTTKLRFSNAQRTLSVSFPEISKEYVCLTLASLKIPQ